MLRPPAEYIDTEEKAAKVLRYLMKQRRVGVDTETTGLQIHKDIVLFWGLATMDRRFCILGDLLPFFSPLFTAPNTQKVFTNAKYDRHIIANSGGGGFAGNIVCTLVLDWLLDENRRSHGLKQCIKDHFGEPMPAFKDVFGKAVRAENQAGEMMAMLHSDSESERQKAIEYTSRDPWESLRLGNYLLGELEKQPIDDSGYNLADHYWEVEEPFGQVLWNMERRGVMVNTDYLEEIAPGIEQQVEKIERKFNRAAGRVLNLNSTPQLRELFFEQLGVMPTKFGKPHAATGKVTPSCDKEVLGAWAEGDIAFWDGQREVAGDEEDVHYVQDLADSLQEHRGLTKFLGTYVRGLETHADENFRIHCTINQHIARTGRITASKPNLTNIPTLRNDRFGIRYAFIADGGRSLGVWDYKTLEMRVMAHFSGDKAMRGAIRKKVDLHGFTVSEMGMGYSIEEVAAAKAKDDEGLPLSERETDILRQRVGSKAVGFGLIYGIGEVKLGRQLGLPIVVRVDKKGRKRETCPEAKKLIGKYFGVFPGVKKFIRDTKAWVHSEGYVQTYLGRFRRLPTIFSGNRQLSTQAERQSVNTIIQGSAADIVKMAMIKCENDPDLQAADARMLLQIHDELMFSVPDHEDIKRDVQERVNHHMEHPFDEPLAVDLPVSGGYATSWGEAK